MDELIEKLKHASAATKVLIVLALGGAYNVYSYINDTPALEAQLSQVKQERDLAKRRYNKAKSDAESLYKLDAALKAIREKLSQAKTYLPDTIHIDEILHTTARFCKRYQVNLDGFSPKPEEPSNDDARYVVKPIALSLTGRFVDIARFFDSIVHLKSIVHLRDIVLEKSEGDNKNGEVLDLFRLTPEQRQRYAERNTKVKATADLLLFKSEV